MSFYDDDLDGFFNDFAVTATIGTGGSQKNIQVIFDEEFQAFSSAAGEVISISPSAHCKTSDVNGYGVGTAFVVNSNNYRVLENKPDGTGISVLALQEI